MPAVPLAVGGAKDGETVLTVGAHGGAAVSLQRGHVVRRTRGLIYCYLVDPARRCSTTTALA
ncbi:hypothetical protein Poly51_12810 [Rubripirellula tenax]|uniref:Uncharacterized protein n=2 Tax=Rubripirellula tenax TaxID=2528015 RepID=A0A5C6FCQ6_9BACT|nr:hypothetical protein Poly51_12810 [Rubripirellula tenax]